MQEIMGAIFPSHVSVILDKISKCGRDYEYIKCLLDDLYVCWGRYGKSTYLLEYLKYSLGLFEIPVCGFMEVDERRGGIMHINMDTGKAWDEKGESVPASQFENFFEERIMHTRLTTFALSVIKEWVRKKEIQLQVTSEPQQVLTYTENLIQLFHGNTHLIDELIGKPDKEKADCITQWARGKDKFGKPLIENPDNGLKKAFAEALKENGIIRESIRTFRDRL